MPLGIHRRTGQRYPFLDQDGTPIDLEDLPAAMAFALAQPAIRPEQLRAVAAHTRCRQLRPARAPPAASSPSSVAAPSSTTSAVIRWVDAQVNLLDLLEELAPATDMRLAGQGYLGWCPFHDDQAPDANGDPGTPSFYVVHNTPLWLELALSVDELRAQRRTDAPQLSPVPGAAPARCRQRDRRGPHALARGEDDWSIHEIRLVWAARLWRAGVAYKRVQPAAECRRPRATSLSALHERARALTRQTCTDSHQRGDTLAATFGAEQRCERDGEMESSQRTSEDRHGLRGSAQTSPRRKRQRMHD